VSGSVSCTRRTKLRDGHHSGLEVGFRNTAYGKASILFSSLSGAAEGGSRLLSQMSTLV
jgi:hypothetical protein